MEQKNRRVFVGNLPPNVVQQDLENIFKKFASVSSVEIKYREEDTFAFVNLQGLKTDINSCVRNVSSKTWKGYQLRVEPAKESFLQRLAKERSEKAKNSGEVVDNAYVENENDSKVPFESSTKNSDKVMNDYHIYCTDRRTSKTSVKRSVISFQGTESKAEVLPQKNSGCNLKISDDKLILEKLETFSRKWNDEQLDISLDSTLPNKMENGLKNNKISPNVNILNKNPNKLVKEEDEILTNTSDIKTQEAEKRRKQAMEARQKELMRRKHAVKFALASVDSDKATKPNQKVVFIDEPLTEDYQIINKETNEKHKLTLFDDDMECEMNPENDFRIRNHYEGKKGQSLLALQARYGNDKRFTLDERFVECEDNEEQTKNEKDYTDGENIVNALDKDVKIGMNKSKHATNLMIRYDPSQPSHKKFVIKQDSNSQCSKKRTREEEKFQHANSTEIKSSELNEIKSSDTRENLPAVSQERYYKVSNDLQKALQNSNEVFSFLETFGNEKKIKGNEKKLDEKIINNKRKEWCLNPFKVESDEDSEGEVNKNRETNENSDDPTVYGVKLENLFFEINDPRFREGLDFICTSNEKYKENFNKERSDLSCIVRTKVLKYRKVHAGQKKIYGRR